MDEFTPVPDETLRELLEVEAKATPGEWAAEAILVGSEERLFLKRGQRDSHLIGGHPNNDPDVPFIAATRNSIRAIVLELRSRREREGELEEKLKSASVFDAENHITICKAFQRDGSLLWAIRRFGFCLARDGEWEAEPIPSSRDQDFASRCRFGSYEECRAAIRSAERKS